MLDRKMPAVRFMVLAGFPDMTVVSATMKSSKKVKQLKKNPAAALLVWSGKEFSFQKVLSIKKIRPDPVYRYQSAPSACGLFSGGCMVLHRREAWGRIFGGTGKNLKKDQNFSRNFSHKKTANGFF